MKKLVLKASLLLFAFHFANAGTESMPSMPKIQPHKVMTVKGGEDFESQKGFGDQAPMVRMMNLMMVEGSGMEGMSMDMSMDMSSEMPGGMPNNKHSDHMQMNSVAQNEMKHSENKSGAPKASEITNADSPYDFQAKNLGGANTVGVNQIEIAITDSKSQKPAKGLNLKAQVFMTSMDMGTEEPEVKEISPGKYQVKAPFAMKGPWAIRLILPDKKEKILNFDVMPKAK